MRVKFRRWGPYVWWICPSRKCNFENKTDLAFVQGEFETKCQYCNTPVTIKLNAQQLSLESSAVEEETKPAAAPAQPPSKVPPAPPSQSPTAPAASPATPPNSPPQTAATSKNPENGEKSKKPEQKKKAAP